MAKAMTFEERERKLEQILQKLSEKDRKDLLKKIKGARERIIDPLFLRRLKAAAQNGSYEELRELEKELRANIDSLEALTTGRPILEIVMSRSKR